MGKVYYNLRAIPIPDDTYCDVSTSRVLLKVANADGTYRRKTIGILATEKTMYPNENFQLIFPLLWQEYYGDKDFKEYELCIGMYGLVLGIAHKINLYPMLNALYGESNVNYILDYAMYSLMDRTGTTQLFPERMKNEVIFAEKLYSDSWYSNFFKNEMPEKTNNEFRIQWLNQCKADGIEEVWLCLDGSNNDCEVEKCSLCEQGESKSHSHSDIVSYMYAVAAGSGKPVTYFVYAGSEPDQQAFHQIALFLGKADIKVKGLIMDAGFCTDKVIATAEECSFEYVIMMHSNFMGHVEMQQLYGDRIKWDPGFCVSDDGVFGTSEKRQIFKTHTRTGYINLYFDGVRGSRQSIDLAKNIRTEKRRLDKLIAKGRTPVVDKTLKDFIFIRNASGSQKEAAYNFDNWRKAASTKGFFSILSSSDFGAEEALSIYRFRDSSETRYSILKSQEGLDTTRVHSTASIYAKFAVGFIESIIRHEIEAACRSLNLDTNVMIHKMDRIHIFLAPGHEYIFSRSIRKDQEQLLKQFDITQKHFEALASETNLRMDSGYKNRYRALPGKHEQHTADRNKGKDEPLEVPSGGSKKTYANPDDICVTQQHRPENKRKKPGRKKGTKDSYQRKRRTKAEMECASKG